MYVCKMCHDSIRCSQIYGTCHNKVTVLCPCYGCAYRRSTGTGTGMPGIQLRACQESSYRGRYGYGRWTDGVWAYVRTVTLLWEVAYMGVWMHYVPFRIKLVWFTPKFRIVVQRLSWKQHIHSLLHGEVTHDTVLSAHTKRSESVGKQYSY